MRNFFKIEKIETFQKFSVTAEQQILKICIQSLKKTFGKLDGVLFDSEI